MDSSSISDGELRTRVLELSPVELAIWAWRQTDKVLFETEDLQQGEEFKADLWARIDSVMKPESQFAFQAALIQFATFTDFDDEGNRVLLPRPERRTRASDRKRDLVANDVPAEIAEKFFQDKIDFTEFIDFIEPTYFDADEAKKKLSEYFSSDEAATDANGRPIMDETTFSKITGLPRHEITKSIERLVAEGAPWGYAPGCDEDGNIIPLKVFGE